jgi:hypothetical protein
MVSFNRVLLQGWNIFKGREENIRTSFHAIKTITFEHERIHSGRYYKHAHIHSLGNGEYHTHYIEPNSGYNLHLRYYNVKADNGPGVLSIYENPYIDASSLGSDVTSDFINLNRASNNYIPASISYGVGFDANSSGVELPQSLLADASKDSGENSSVGDQEIILNSQRKYLLKYDNNAGAVVTTLINIGIYDPSSS